MNINRHRDIFGTDIISLLIVILSLRCYSLESNYPKRLIRDLKYYSSPMIFNHRMRDT